MAQPSVNLTGFRPRDVILTCGGFSSINWDCDADAFEFVFSDEKSFRVHSVLAQFLSPAVARHRRCDPSFTRYIFEKSSADLADTFESLLSRMRAGQSLKVDSSNFGHLIRLARELQNDELLSSILTITESDSIELDEALCILQVGTELGTGFLSRAEALKDFVASHFYEIHSDSLNQLDLETASNILASPSLKIKDEDSLYDFVRSRAETDPCFSELFEFVCFEYLTDSRIEDFVEFTSKFLLGELNSGIWSRICRRLVRAPPVEDRNPRAVVPPGKECQYQASKPLDGIIAHLTRECGGNVHDKGVVAVTASSVYSNDCEPKNAADLGSDSEFFSKNELDAWICYDFKERRVAPTSYTVKSYNFGPGGRHLKSWALEVSNDGSSWAVVDRRDNNSDLNGSHATHNFPLSHVPGESFRFVRLRQTGPNHLSVYYVSITALEIFGTIA